MNHQLITSVGFILVAVALGTMWYQDDNPLPRHESIAASSSIEAETQAQETTEPIHGSDSNTTVSTTDFERKLRSRQGFMLSVILSVAAVGAYGLLSFLPSQEPTQMSRESSGHNLGATQSSDKT